MLGFSFSEGFAPFVQNNKYGYFDKTGNVVIEAQFFYAGDFFNGLACAALSDMERGLIDKTGKMILGLYHGAVSNFSEGLSAVTVGSKMGFMDRSGRMVIPPQLNSVGIFPLAEASADEIDRKS